MLLQLLENVTNPSMLLAFVLFLIIPLLFSLAFHELAHGYAAYKFGDPTAKSLGRLTLNPLKHLDVVGTILLLVIGLGWAKPIPVNILNVPNRTQQMLIAFAGPFSNILLALLFSLLLTLPISETPYGSLLLMAFHTTVKINLALAFFNLLPIPPLDGSRILSWLLPERLESGFQKIEKYGFAVLLLIMVTVGFSWVFYVVDIIQNNLYQLLGI